MRLARTLALLLLATSTAACAATTYDTSISTETLAPTTTVLPKGTAAELLPQLVTESAGLSALIVDGGDKIANVERMEALWAAVSAEVTARDRDLANSIGAEIVKSRAAPTFNRPASADKAYRNLKVLVQAYLAGA
ncbi:MAG TPA: hypothetical protein VHQ23_03485 [Ilumatobacteraceae bacterium]|nr:hypothetical protein [Ilumatobacteraceae bacterium]